MADIDHIRLMRPIAHPALSRKTKFRVVMCCSTRSDPDNTYTIVVDDNGHWSIECEECGETMTLSDLMELGNAGE